MLLARFSGFLPSPGQPWTSSTHLLLSRLSWLCSHQDLSFLKAFRPCGMLELVWFALDSWFPQSLRYPPTAAQYDSLSPYPEKDRRGLSFLPSVPLQNFPPIHLRKRNPSSAVSSEIVQFSGGWKERTPNHINVRFLKRRCSTDYPLVIRCVSEDNRDNWRWDASLSSSAEERRYRL